MHAAAAYLRVHRDLLDCSDRVRQMQRKALDKLVFRSVLDARLEPRGAKAVSSPATADRRYSSSSRDPPVA